jgi:hypothetical protein
MRYEAVPKAKNVTIGKTEGRAFATIWLVIPAVPQPAMNRQDRQVSIF